MAQNNRFSKKKNKYNFWHSPAILIVLFLVLVLFAYNLLGLIKKEQETDKNKISELSKIDEMRAEHDNLTKDINTLSSPEGIEETLRDKYNVVKPGEKMVVIVDDKTPAQAPTGAPIDHSFWGFIKRMFGQK